jgi:transposase-like protein
MSKKFTAEQKAAILDEARTNPKHLTAKKHGISTVTLWIWRKKEELNKQ